MLLTIQFPIADSRAFLTYDTGKLDVPTWPAPVTEQEFVRFFGGIKTRRLGGLMGWVGENEVCDARHALRITPLSQVRFGLRNPLHCAFRRFYFDGLATGKFEVGVCSKRYKHKTLTPEIDRSLIESFIHLPVEVKDPSGETKNCELYTAGKYLASLYVSASTDTTRNIPKPKKIWWVQDGPPSLFLEYKSSERLKGLPRTAEVNIPKRYGFKLNYLAIPVKGKLIRMWAIGLRSDCDLRAARSLRLYLLRLNAEHACLRSVLRNIEANHIKGTRGTEAFNTLQFYLHYATRRIKRWEANSRELVESESADIARASEDFISPGQRDALLERLQILNIRKNIYDKIDKYACEWEGSKDTSITLYGGTVVMGDEYKVSGQAGAIGRNAHAHDINFNQVWSQVHEDINLPRLAQELSRLRSELKKLASEPEHDMAVGAVAAAEDEAHKGNGSKVLEYLASAGKWTLEVATKIGAPLATDAIKKSLGM